MPTWQITEVDLGAPALLKRVSVDVAGEAQGYLMTFLEQNDTGVPVAPTYYAGTLPHLRRYTSERAVRAHAIALTPDTILTLPEEARCRFLRLYHQGKGDYTVRDFRAHLTNTVEEE